jgi:hypothetical protein
LNSAGLNACAVGNFIIIIIIIIREQDLNLSLLQYWWLDLKRNAYRILMGKPEGARPLGRPICGWEDNIEMEPREIMNTVTNVWVP